MLHFGKGGFLGGRIRSGSGSAPILVPYILAIGLRADAACPSDWRWFVDDHRDLGDLVRLESEWLPLLACGTGYIASSASLEEENGVIVWYGSFEKERPCRK